MNIPSLHDQIWSLDTERIPFHEVMTWNVAADHLLQIKAELLKQYQVDAMAAHWPNLDWQSPRFQEKWQEFAQSSLAHVVLPKSLWTQWIQELQGKAGLPFTQAYSEVEANKPNSPAPVETEIPSQEIPEEQVVEEAPIAESPSPAPMEQTLEAVLTSNEPWMQAEVFVSKNSEQKVLDVLETPLSGQEKVFEKIQLEATPLKQMVESSMVQNLQDSIGLNQKIKFTQNLFQGQVDQWQALLQFIDHEAQSQTWEAEIMQRYADFFNADNAQDWKELFALISKKFS